MRIGNKWAAFVYRLVIVAAAAVGLGIQTGLLGSDGLNLGSLRYFTLLSNLVCLVYFLVDAFFCLRRGRNACPRLKGAIAMAITVTGIVYHTMLSGDAFSMGGVDDPMFGSALGQLGNQLLHTVVPIMTVGDWLLFDEKGTYRLSCPFIWTLLPDAYFVYATARGFLLPAAFNGDRFQYPFINYDLLGWKVIPIVIGLNVAFILLGFVYLGVDRLLAKSKAAAGPAAG